MVNTFYNHVAEAMQQENMTLKEVGAKLNEHGITGVEIDYRDLNPTGKSFNKELAKELKEAGIPIYGVYVFYDWARKPFDNSYKRIYKELQSIGVKNSLAIPGMVPDGMDVNKAMARMCKKLSKAVLYAKECGITVLMEDFDDSIAPFSTSEGMLYFFERIPDLKCAFDTGNFYYSNEDALEVLPKFLDRTAYVHCKDRSLEVKEGEEPKLTITGEAMYSAPVGGGIIPFDKIIPILKEHGYKGDYVVEHFGSKHQLQDMIESVEYLKTII